MKRGQATVFIILGLIIAIILILVFVFKDQISTELQQTQLVTEETQDVYDYVEDCIDSIALNTLYQISSQGGFHQVPSPKLDYSLVEIPILFYEQETTEITKEQIESEFSQAFNNNLLNCIDFTIFNKQIESQQPSIQTTITDQEILIETEFPIEITIEQDTFNLKDFNYEITTNFNSFVELKDEIIELQKQKSNVLPLSELVTLAQDKNLNIEITRDEETVVLAIYDPNNNELYYNFAIKYNWIDET